ncbi:MAG: hypothetical protein IJN34_04605 [Clostridia bacterium]|nr:hypothetical protein [Clostridia bacterium]
MGIQIHRFSVSVNCHLPAEGVATDCVQDFQKRYEDSGFIILPESYSDDGAPTRLVINCHGAGGTVTTDDSQVEHQAATQYLVANGFAVMDVNGLPFEYAAEMGIDIRNNIGSPIAMRSYVKAYHYCMEHFNLKPEVFVHGGSMGGISSTNLVLSGMIPVIAHSAFCPVLDTYNQIYLRPWSGGLPKEALGKIYGLEKDGQGEYIYEEQKVCGYNPAKNKKAECYPVPVKFWQCVDDPVVPYEVTERFIGRIKAAGGVAHLRPFPYGGHEPQDVGAPIESPCGIDVYKGEKIHITPAVEELFIWINNYN